MNILNKLYKFFGFIFLHLFTIVGMFIGALPFSCPVTVVGSIIVFLIGNTEIIDFVITNYWLLVLIMNIPTWVYLVIKTEISMIKQQKFYRRKK